MFFFLKNWGLKTKSFLFRKLTLVDKGEYILFLFEDKVDCEEFQDVKTNQPKSFSLDLYVFNGGVQYFSASSSSVQIKFYFGSRTVLQQFLFSSTSVLVYF